MTAAGLGPLRGFQHFNYQQQGRWIEHIEHDTASTWSMTIQCCYIYSDLSHLSHSYIILQYFTYIYSISSNLVSS